MLKLKMQLQKKFGIAPTKPLEITFDLDLRYVNEIPFTKYIGDPTTGKYDWHL